MSLNSRFTRAGDIRSLAISSAFVALIVSTAPASAGPVLVVDASSGAVLVSEDAGRAWHPASTTKMMTLYVALKAIKARQIGLETAIPASKLAASQRPVKVHIKAGQEITLDNAMKIMMVKSANDIAYVIAEGVGGSVETFVAMMNAEARRLGMSSSRFVNPNGWHHPDQQTSARDLAVLAMTLMREFPEYAGYWGIGAVQLGRTTLNNTNGLMGRYAGASGFKTGFVCASGFNVVATASQGGRTLIAVVMGAMSGAERTIRASQLLDEGFSKWGGTGYSLASIPGDSGRASSICEELKRRGKGVVFSDDADFEGPISFGTSTVLTGGNTESGREPMSGPAQRGTALARSSSGRLTLGARASFAPVQVGFGRTAGSASAPLAANVAGRAPTAVAAVPDTTLAPGARPRTLSPTGAIPASATAFAPTRPLSAKPQVVEVEQVPTGAPLSLQGAIRSGGNATPAALRPSASAGIKPPPSPIKQANASTKTEVQKPGAVELAARKAVSAKPATTPPEKPVVANASKIKPVADKKPDLKAVTATKAAAGPKPKPAPAKQKSTVTEEE
jgi:D-alanyl-D-alanine carboxypeptidase